MLHTSQIDQTGDCRLKAPDMAGLPEVVLADADRVRGVLLNLMTNAAKFTKRCGTMGWESGVGGEEEGRVGQRGALPRRCDRVFLLHQKRDPARLSIDSRVTQHCLVSMACSTSPRKMSVSRFMPCRGYIAVRVTIMKQGQYPVPENAIEERDSSDDEADAPEEAPQEASHRQRAADRCVTPPHVMCWVRCVVWQWQTRAFTEHARACSGTAPPIDSFACHAGASLCATTWFATSGTRTSAGRERASPCHGKVPTRTWGARPSREWPRAWTCRSCRSRGGKRRGGVVAACW